MIHRNSQTAYDVIKPTLQKRCLDVYSCLRIYGPMTNQEIAEKMGRAINRVTGRVTKMLDDKVLHRVGSKKVKGFSQRVVGIIGLHEKTLFF